jgi:hypothetical protein
MSSIAWRRNDAELSQPQPRHHLQQADAGDAEAADGGAVIVLGGGERGASASCENRDLRFFAGPKAAGVPN